MTEKDPEFALNLFDKFTEIYNAKYNAKGSLFEGINEKDLTSTNDKMELFYEYMQYHNDLAKENPEMIDVYDPDSKIINSDKHEIYALCVGKEKKPVYISLSFISLLSVGVREIKKRDWIIIML